MTTKTYHIDNNIAVTESTIIKHWSTADLDGQGYLTRNGADRTLCEARATRGGAWVLFAKTNGDPSVLYEGGGDDFVDLMTDSNSDQTREEVIRKIIDAIQDQDLRDWASDILKAAN